MISDVFFRNAWGHNIDDSYTGFRVIFKKHAALLYIPRKNNIGLISREYDSNIIRLYTAPYLEDGVDKDKLCVVTIEITNKAHELYATPKVTMAAYTDYTTCTVSYKNKTETHIMEKTHFAVLLTPEVRPTKPVLIHTPTYEEMKVLL